MPWSSASLVKPRRTGVLEVGTKGYLNTTGSLEPDTKIA